MNFSFNGTLKPPKNITQFNTKLGFSVTHIPTNFMPPPQNLFNPDIEKLTPQILPETETDA